MNHNTISSSEQERLILKKIRTLPPDKIAEVADFVGFLSQKNQERQLRLSPVKWRKTRSKRSGTIPRMMPMTDYKFLMEI